MADNVAHVALSHPEVSVKFIREGKLQYVTPGDGQLRSAAYAVLGREFSRDLIEVHSEEGLYRVSGLITPPKSCRASRSMQHFYINGRYVRNRTIMAGMEMAFKGTTMQGKFPGGILLLEMPTDLVDVNVHPAKIEARFARENDVFDVVYHAVKLALAQPGTGERRFTFEADKNEKSEKENDTKNENDVKNNHFTGLSAVIPGQADPGTLPAQRWEAPPPQRPAAAPVKTPAFTADTPPVQPAQPARAAAAVPSWRQSAPAEDILDPVVTLHSPEKPDATEVQPAPQPFRAAAGEAQLDVHPETDTTADPLLDHMAAWNTVPAAPEIEAATVPYQPEEPEQPEQPEQLGFDVPQGEEPLRYVGEVFRTYILAERGDELCLIDKHAAHERQLYEKLAANYGNVPSQLLLQPAAIDLSAEEKQALLENQPLLENAGPGCGGLWRQYRAAARRARGCRAAERRGPAGGDRRPPAQGQPGRTERAHRVGAALHLLPRRHQGGGQVLAAGADGTGREDPLRRGAAFLPPWSSLRAQTYPKGVGKAVWTHRVMQNPLWWLW